MNAIVKFIELLRAGDVVAFPTETVYGLGADATNAAAVRKIFQLKGRPSTNPLICHVADASVAKRYARQWPEIAEKLANEFWPGALTLVLPKTDSIVNEATAGLKTVGLRAPDHPLALELLRAFDRPLAGPSANKSSHVSPTTAQHVRDEFGDALLILDGGPCRIGIESTVLDLSVDAPTILRPGGVSRDEIEKVIGPVSIKSLFNEANRPTKAPGQHSIHYAPRTPAYRLPFNMPGATISIGEEYKDRGSQVTLPNRPDEYARLFYAALRKLDAMNLERINIVLPPATPEWAAVRDRILRATKPRK